jgi:hypothetical protein
MPARGVRRPQMMNHATFVITALAIAGRASSLPIADLSPNSRALTTIRRAQNFFWLTLSAAARPDRARRLHVYGAFKSIRLSAIP